MTFSHLFTTYKDWLNNFKGSENYRNRIVREHAKYPHASLSQLRGHTPKGKGGVSTLKSEPVFKRSWTSISRKELGQRERSLDVLSKVRKGKSLTEASKELHTTPKTVIRNTNAFSKVNGKWVAKTQDRISRVMSIYENGKQEWVEVKDSRTASKIGKYNSAVNQFLITGNEEVLKPFKKPFKDAQGKTHKFEIDPDKLYAIAEAQEEPEFYEVYRI